MSEWGSESEWGSVSAQGSVLAQGSVSEWGSVSAQGSVFVWPWELSSVRTWRQAEVVSLSSVASPDSLSQRSLQMLARP